MWLGGRSARRTRANPEQQILILYLADEGGTMPFKRM
ncbi:hypothetical protein BH24ACI4_BH24ACI4_22160 [soil metagenome]